jgi:NAD(P)-dependent dehydrogenase (short-subunit alcohol dehydrogenase family)
VQPRLPCHLHYAGGPARTDLVVIGGSADIGLETARLARDEGVELIITARNPERLERVGRELGDSVAAFDASDFDQLDRFFDELSNPIDHVLLTGPVPITRRWRNSTSMRHAVTSIPI